MIGFATIATGYALLVVGIVVTLGLWTLIPAGSLLVIVGVFVDLDRIKESPRAQRSRPTPP